MVHRAIHYARGSRLRSYFGNQKQVRSCDVITSRQLVADDNSLRDYLVEYGGDGAKLYTRRCCMRTEPKTYLKLSMLLVALSTAHISQAQLEPSRPSLKADGNLTRTSWYAMPLAAADGASEKPKLPDTSGQQRKSKPLSAGSRISKTRPSGRVRFCCKAFRWPWAGTKKHE